jgi:hypothetical protein
MLSRRDAVNDLPTSISKKLRAWAAIQKKPCIFVMHVQTAMIRCTLIAGRTTLLAERKNRTASLVWTSRGMRSNKNGLFQARLCPSAPLSFGMLLPAPLLLFLSQCHATAAIAHWRNHQSLDALAKPALRIINHQLNFFAIKQYFRTKLI